MLKPCKLDFQLLRKLASETNSSKVFQIAEALETLSEQEIAESARFMAQSGYSPTNPEAFFRMAKFLAYDFKAEWKPLPRFGLWLSGECGRGKTFFVESCLARFGRYLVVSTHDVNSWFEADGTAGVLSALEQRAMYPLCIDDVGVEEAGNHYGIRDNAVAIAIAERCRIGNRVPLSITTNLSSQQLIEKYGGRTVSRLYELTYRVDLTGEDKREEMFIERNKIFQ